MVFSHKLPEQTTLRKSINNAYRMDETACLDVLLQAAELSRHSFENIERLAHRLVIEVRRQRVGKGGIDAFMYEYDLSSEEGIALMCLAEAMLRVPDTETLDHLIRDKVLSADWESHVGKSDSYFVNAASWGLMLTGKILSPEKANSSYLAKVIKRLLERFSEPVIRKAVGESMKILGRQFVMGRTIEEAIKRSREQEKLGYRFSYDLLGEAARTSADAERYFNNFLQAINVIAKAADGRDIIEGPGICIKLSALHPRYEVAQYERAVPILIDRVRTLCLQAKNQNIALTIDAEEADRLELSMNIIEAIISDTALKGWDGLGLAVQAYQKRAYYLIDWLADLGHRYKHRINLRLVKGAYWDYEIKDSQMKGLDNYPIFTRKASTDVSYLACAKKIINHGKVFYPQFGTHNAYTVAAIIEMMGTRRDYEFQCLKGMGRTLYDQLLADKELNIQCRTYAPVGSHQDLLPYLVRRLLENGANSSFVNRIVDENAPIEELIAHPVLMVKALAEKPHSKIPLPADIFAKERKNSQGIDLSDFTKLLQLTAEMEKASSQHWSAVPLIGVDKKRFITHDVLDPSNHKSVIGAVAHATPEDLDIALERATIAAPRWDKVNVIERAACLDRIADLFEQNMSELMAMAVREAGKTIPDALGEIREAVDFCRYYAAIARQDLTPKVLKGYTGEYDELQAHGRGVILCISPWNFPLAIFTGQIVAALVTGNCVIAKPAEQTPLIAARAVELMYQAGIPNDVLQFLPGDGPVIGGAAVADKRINGVMFTGSTETARLINQTLANREGPIVPLIAETGGQNALIADTTALPEQLVVDVINSAFNSAGQRCSALRVLYLQEEMADHFIHMLKGAMAELKLGEPSLLSTDIGPVIDQDAKRMLEAHVERMSKEAKILHQLQLPKPTQYGSFFPPTVIEIDSLQRLPREIFGPVLHIIRYKTQDLEKVIAEINSTGYGLTLGIHTRIDEKAHYIQSCIRTGNAYINRNIIGAVVGVQPFGGEGLSGTGPKAGGPHYLARLCNERTLSINTTAAGGNASLLAISE